MIDRIARLGKETAVYGLSTVLGRMLNFLLVPLYANTLLPEENGVVATLYAYIAFAAVVYGLGMEQAFMRFWADAPPADRPRLLRTAMLGSLPGVALSAVIAVAGESAAVALGFTPAERTLILLSSVILAVDAIAVVPFALLRMEGKALRFALLKILNIVLTLVLSIVLLAVLQTGIVGVFQANLVASATTLAALLWVVRGQFRAPAAPVAAPSWGLRDLLRFGLPLVPAGLAGIALQVVDRPILKALTDDATVGIYQLNMRLGIFMMLAVGMFDFAWRPFFLQHARDADAKPMFARVFTYLTALMGIIFVAVSLFVPDVVRFPMGGRTFMPETYWAGSAIVPVVLCSYAFVGAYVVFLTGVYIDKRTGKVPMIAGTAAALTVAANVLLVPELGIMGAAVAALAGRVVQAGWMYVEGQRWFRVEYEWGRIARIIVWTVTVTAAVVVADLSPLSATGIIVKSLAVVLYVAGFRFLGIIRPGEFSRLPAMPAG